MKWRSVWVIFVAGKDELKMRTSDYPAGQSYANIENKLEADQRKIDSPRTMEREPPDSEEQQDAKHRLITMKDRQGR